MCGQPKYPQDEYIPVDIHFKMPTISQIKGWSIWGAHIMLFLWGISRPIVMATVKDKGLAISPAFFVNFVLHIYYSYSPKYYKKKRFVLPAYLSVFIYMFILTTNIRYKFYHEAIPQWLIRQCVFTV
mgnify:CR=1 FL=1